MADGWRDVWRSKGTEPHSLSGSTEEITQALLKLDGYDSQYCNLSVGDWFVEVDRVCDSLELRPTDTVYEVGCGAGALLYALQPRCRAVGGLDYSEPLLAIAKRILVSDDLRLWEAIDL